MRDAEAILLHTYSLYSGIGNGQNNIDSGKPQDTQKFSRW